MNMITIVVNAMKTLTTIVITAAAAMLGAIGFAYSGMYDVSASSPHSGFVNWFLSTTSHASVERRASERDRLARWMN